MASKLENPFIVKYHGVYNHPADIPEEGPSSEPTPPPTPFVVMERCDESLEALLKRIEEGEEPPLTPEQCFV